MDKLAFFKPEMSDALKYYVYRLVDPRNGETFYVGKGNGNRVFEHLNNALSSNGVGSEDEITEKFQRIKDIKNAGLDVVHIIHRHGMEENVALEVEGALIEAYPCLSNIQNGHGNNDRGSMHVQEIMEKYALPSFEPDPTHNLILININSYDGFRNNKEALLQKTQFAWRIDAKRANQADYVIAVIKGVAVGVFKPIGQWIKATKEHFPALQQDIPGRYGFNGSVADDVWDYYIGERGKRIDNESLRHSQNPIRYVSKNIS